MTYGYVYVAHVAMGADYNQCIKAIAEAESYHGPSLIIGYAPCINHGIKGGMGVSQVEEKKAVAAGYWHNFRFDPRRADEGQNPFQLDSKAPTASYRDFIMGEVRYNSLTRSFPERAEKLFANAAPEIAAAMLQRQQAEAIVAARKKIVEGAVGMVEMALAQLNDDRIVDLDEERKAAMVSNLLVVLCGNKDAQPIVNSGSIY